MAQDKPVPQDDWKTIIQHVPLVSVDLVVQHGGAVLLGKRTNKPAKDEWFTPGGTVHKHERFVDAAHRIAQEELGIQIQIERQLGVYEHFYDNAEFDDIDGKHYVPIGFVVTAENRDITSDDQHSSLGWFTPPFDTLSLHPYVQAYLRDAGVLSEPE